MRGIRCGFIQWLDCIIMDKIELSSTGRKVEVEPVIIRVDIHLKRKQCNANIITPEFLHDTTVCNQRVTVHRLALLRHLVRVSFIATRGSIAIITNLTDVFVGIPLRSGRLRCDTCDDEQKLIDLPDVQIGQLKGHMRILSCIIAR